MNIKWHEASTRRGAVMTKTHKRLLMLLLVVVFIISEWGELNADSLLKLALALVGV